MGGILAAETLLSITSETPISNGARSSLSSDTTANPSSPPHSFMFPYIQGVLAFDTPYLGINPGVLAHGAEAQYQQASSAYQALSSAASAFGWSGTSAAATTGATKSAGLLTAGPATATADAAAAPAWQRWGKLAMFAGAAGAVAAGGAAAYVNRGNITEGWSWATSHLEFVGCLMRGEELKTRLAGVMAANSERCIGFANLYSQLDKKAPAAGGSAESYSTIGLARTFCNLPTRTDWREFFQPAINVRATDEIKAHMEMFLPRSNPGFYRLAELAKEHIVHWVDDSWYAGSERRKGEDDLAGDEPILI